MAIKNDHLSETRQAGFTLIEIAITLILTAVILSIVIGANQIIRRARIYRLFTEIKEISEATTLYQQRYQSYPGDTANASTLFNCVHCNGDDNGIPDPLLFWQHLSLAGLIKGTYHGIDAPQQGYPESRAFPGYYFKIRTGAFGRVMLILTTSDASANGVLTPNEAYQFDRAYDDGQVNIGWIGAEDPTNASTSCRDNAGLAYRLDYNAQICNPTYILAGEPYFHYRWQAGPWQPCDVTPTWNESPWGACSESCGGGIQTRTITCDANVSGTQTRSKTCVSGVDFSTVSNMNCTGLPEPTISQACTGRCSTPSPAILQVCNPDPCDP